MGNTCVLNVVIVHGQLSENIVRADVGIFVLFHAGFLKSELLIIN